jgi:hypothetical protein
VFVRYKLTTTWSQFVVGYSISCLLVTQELLLPSLSFSLSLSLSLSQSQKRMREVWVVSGRIMSYLSFQRLGVVLVDCLVPQQLRLADFLPLLPPPSPLNSSTWRGLLCMSMCAQWSCLSSSPPTPTPPPSTTFPSFPLLLSRSLVGRWVGQLARGRTKPLPPPLPGIGQP